MQIEVLPMEIEGRARIGGTIRERENEREYLLARAEAELELAQRSEDEDAVRSHYELAGLYLDLVYNDEAFAQWKQDHPETLVAHAPEGGHRAIADRPRQLAT